MLEDSAAGGEEAVSLLIRCPTRRHATVAARTTAVKTRLRSIRTSRVSVGARSYRDGSVAVETLRLYLTSMNPALPEASSARRRLISTSARCDHNGRCLRASGPSRQALASSARSGPVHPCTTHEHRFLDLSSRAFSSWRPPRTSENWGARALANQCRILGRARERGSTVSCR